MDLFSGFSASAIALVATQVDEKRLGYALGWPSSGQLLGGVAGPLLGGIFAILLGDYRYVFFWASGISLIVLVLDLLVVRESRAPAAEPRSRRVQSPIRQLMSLRHLQGLGAMFVVLLLAQFARRAVQPVVTVYVRDLLGPVAYLSLIAGFAFSVTGLGDLVAAPFLGKCSDSIGYQKVLLISLTRAAVFNIPQHWPITSMFFWRPVLSWACLWGDSSHGQRSRGTIDASPGAGQSLWPHIERLISRQFSGADDWRTGVCQVRDPCDVFGDRGTHGTQSLVGIPCGARASWRKDFAGGPIMVSASMRETCAWNRASGWRCPL